MAGVPLQGPRTLGPPAPLPARRVVTLAPSLTELVVALGKGETLVGVSRFDELAAVKDVPRVGGFVDPNVEAVMVLHADLVLVQPSPGNQRPVEKLAELGTPVLLLPLRTTWDVLVAFRAVGRALGAPERGEALAQTLERARARVRSAAKALPHPRVLFVYGFSPLVVAGPGSFADELLMDAGGVNVVAASLTPYPVYSLESAVAAKPDVVVDGSNVSGGQERLRELPGLKAARWERLPSQALMHPGPSLADGLAELFRLLHPTLRPAPPGE